VEERQDVTGKRDPTGSQSLGVPGGVEERTHSQTLPCAAGQEVCDHRLYAGLFVRLFTELSASWSSWAAYRRDACSGGASARARAFRRPARFLWKQRYEGFDPVDAFDAPLTRTPREHDAFDAGDASSVRSWDRAGARLCGPRCLRHVIRAQTFMISPVSRARSHKGFRSCTR
jgi:hypothetical protein